MRRRFGRGRRTIGSSDSKDAPIDAARWFERLIGEGIVKVQALEPVSADDVPASFAVVGSGEREGGERTLVGFAPGHGGDAALAVLAVAQRLAAEGGFEGEALAVAPQWSIAARRRLALVGELPFRFRALAASSLGENEGAVELEKTGLPLPLPRICDRQSSTTSSRVPVGTVRQPMMTCPAGAFSSSITTVLLPFGSGSLMVTRSGSSCLGIHEKY